MSEFYYEPEQTECITPIIQNICNFCEKKVTDICPVCCTGLKCDVEMRYLVWRISDPRKYVISCPNKHVYHAQCLLNWAMYESYCPTCYEELNEASCECCD